MRLRVICVEIHRYTCYRVYGVHDVNYVLITCIFNNDVHVWMQYKREHRLCAYISRLIDQYVLTVNCTLH